MSVQEIINKVDELRDEAASILCDLIRIPTVNPPGDRYHEFCRKVAELLSSWGIRCEIVQVPRDYVIQHIPEYVDFLRFILIAKIGTGKGPTLHFNGHYDVVPAGTGWTVCKPFDPKVIDDKVYGRGACDMKGGIVSILLALKLLTKIENKLNGTVEIALVPDEEIGGATGTGYLVNVMNIRPDYVVVAEPTGLDKIVIGNKGLVWLMVEVLGKQAHAATPWLGVNAFELGVKFAAAIIDELKRKTEERVSSYEYDIEGGNRATITFGGDVRSAGKVNVVPGVFAFSIDRRVIPEENVDQVEKELVDYLYSRASSMNITINVKILQKSPPAVTSPDADIVKKLENAIREVTCIQNVRKVVCTGGLDTRYYQVKGCQAVTYGPGDVSCAHQADEYVSIRDVLTVTKVYLKLVEKLLL